MIMTPKRYDAVIGRAERDRCYPYSLIASNESVELITISIGSGLAEL